MQLSTAVSQQALGTMYPMLLRKTAIPAAKTLPSFFLSLARPHPFPPRRIRTHLPSVALCTSTAQALAAWQRGSVAPQILLGLEETTVHGCVWQLPTRPEAWLARVWQGAGRWSEAHERTVLVTLLEADDVTDDVKVDVAVEVAVGHAVQLPPQSLAVSSPFLLPSLHVGHAGQVAPPQSMPVSSPSVTPSMHVACTGEACNMQAAQPVCARTRTHAHTHTRTRAHAHTHAHTHTQWHG